jgi:hypothetical protein
MADTFTCDRCGNQFEQRQLKEAFIDENGERVRKELCPSCLDEVMNASEDVRGIAGEEKRAAVSISGGAAREEVDKTS